MKLIKLKQTEHSYYCNDANYYVSPIRNNNWGSFKEFNNWEHFKSEGWLDLDIDMNLIFRFDIEDCKETKDKVLKLYLMHQRKGAFRPIHIHNMKEEDMKEVTKLLQDNWLHLKEMWKEVWS